MKYVLDASPVLLFARPINVRGLHDKIIVFIEINFLQVHNFSLTVNKKHKKLIIIKMNT